MLNQATVDKMQAMKMAAHEKSIAQNPVRVRFLPFTSLIQFRSAIKGFPRPIQMSKL